MRRLVYALAVGLVGGGVALAADVSDKTFADKAAAGGMAEVKLSKLAMDKGQSTEVKQFARKMVEDHTKAGEELKQIADQQSIPLPTALDEQHQKLYDKLERLSGPEFDKQYMRAMAADHGRSPDEAVHRADAERQGRRSEDVRDEARCRSSRSTTTWRITTTTTSSIANVEEWDFARDALIGDAPARAARRVHDLDAAGGELGADGVGAGEVLRLARVGAGDELRLDGGGVDGARGSGGRGGRRARRAGRASQRPSSPAAVVEDPRRARSRVRRLTSFGSAIAVEDAVGERRAPRCHAASASAVLKSSSSAAERGASARPRARTAVAVPASAGERVAEPLQREVAVFEAPLGLLERREASGAVAASASSTTTS